MHTKHPTKNKIPIIRKIKGFTSLSDTQLPPLRSNVPFLQTSLYHIPHSSPSFIGIPDKISIFMTLSHFCLVSAPSISSFLEKYPANAKHKIILILFVIINFKSIYRMK